MLALRRLLAATVACSFVACSRPATPPSQVPHAPPPAPRSGIDLAGIDRSVAPGDDFDGHANGAWRAAAVIPDDVPSTGVAREVSLRAEERTHSMIQELVAKSPAPGSNEQRIADFYAAFMDEEAIEQRGLAAIAPMLAAIEAIRTRSELSRYLGSELRADVDPLNATHLHTDKLFGLFVAQRLDDPTVHVAYLLQGGLGLPDRDYYLSSREDMAALRAPYRAYVAALLAGAGISGSAAKANAIVALETKLAAFHATIVETEDCHKANNPWSRKSFSKRAPGIDWAAFFDAAGLANQETIVAWQPGAIQGISKLVASQPLATWKSWLTFHAIHHHATVLPKVFADQHFALFGKRLQGIPTQKVRWKRAVAGTNRALGDAVGELYVHRHFPPSSQAQVKAIVDNLIAAFRARVDTLGWMSAATKEKAKAKAATLRVGIGYPATLRDYGAFEVQRDDAAGNLMRSELHEYRHQLAKLGQPVDKEEWWITPQTVNALNLPLQNAMNFPAAILEPPFFDPKADAAANYGAIGAIIGHEISHSFDNLGAEFDAEGRLAGWWTPEDYAHFKAAGQALVAQYAAYEPMPGVHVDGEQTLGENIADLSGLTIAHAAYVQARGGAAAPVIDGLTGDQRFFLAYAQAWRQKSREAAQRHALAVDTHAPAALRAQTVRNVDAWYEAFPSQPGQKLHLPVDARVRIW